MPEDCEAGSYNDLQLQVIRHFECDWARFLRAVQNPAEILEFVLEGHCGGDQEAFSAWFAEKGLPADWMRRFEMARINAVLTEGAEESEEPAETPTGTPATTAGPNESSS